jgi:hypothetical protein
MRKCRKWFISYTFCPKIGKVGVVVGAGRVQTKPKGEGSGRFVDRRGFASSLLKKGRVELLKKGFGDALSATPHREVFGVSVLVGLWGYSFGTYAGGL